MLRRIARKGRRVFNLWRAIRASERGDWWRAQALRHRLRGERSQARACEGKAMEWYERAAELTSND